MKTTATLATRCLQAIDHLHAVHFGIHITNGGDDIFTRRQQCTNDVEILAGILAVNQRRQRRVNDAIGIHLQQLVLVIGRFNTELLNARYFAGIHSHFLRGIHIQSNQREILTLRHCTNSVFSNISAGPLNYFVCHWVYLVFNIEHHGASPARLSGTSKTSVSVTGLAINCVPDMQFIQRSQNHSRRVGKIVFTGGKFNIA